MGKLIFTSVILLCTSIGYAVPPAPSASDPVSVGGSATPNTTGTVNADTMDSIGTPNDTSDPYPPSTSNPNIQGDTQIQHGSSTTNATTGTSDSIRH